MSDGRPGRNATAYVAAPAEVRLGNDGFVVGFGRWRMMRVGRRPPLFVGAAGPGAVGLQGARA